MAIICNKYLTSPKQHSSVMMTRGYQGETTSHRHGLTNFSKIHDKNTFNRLKKLQTRSATHTSSTKAGSPVGVGESAGEVVC